MSQAFVYVWGVPWASCLETAWVAAAAAVSYGWRDERRQLAQRRCWQRMHQLAVSYQRARRDNDRA